MPRPLTKDDAPTIAKLPAFQPLTESDVIELANCTESISLVLTEPDSCQPAGMITYTVGVNYYRVDYLIATDAIVRGTLLNLLQRKAEQRGKAIISTVNEYDIFKLQAFKIAGFSSRLKRGAFESADGVEFCWANTKAKKTAKAE